MSDRRKVGIAYASQPFGGNIYRDAVSEAHGLSLYDIVKAVPNLPDHFWEYGVICINDQVIDRKLWKRIKPKATTPSGVPVVVTLHIAPKGGKGSSTLKNVITVVAVIAIVVATAFIGAGGLTAILPTVFSAASFGAGTLGAALVAAGVATAGNLLLNALTPPPTKPDSAFGGDRPSGDAHADGNVVDPGGILPRVIGTHRIFPPLLAAPLVDIDEGVEIVEAIYGLAGPHQLEDLQVDGLTSDLFTDMTIETRSGFDTDTPISLISRYANTKTPQIELSQHAIDQADSGKRKLLHPTSPDQDLPVWHTVISRDNPDEIWLHLLWPQGMSDSGAATTDLSVPIRLRMRPHGSSTWVNLPEIHLETRKTDLLRKYIRIIWSPTAPDVPSGDVPTTDSFIRMYHTVPQQTVDTFDGTPLGGWNADSHFVNSATITDVKNVKLYKDGARIYVDGASFPRGTAWEVGIIRGCHFASNQFTASTYVHAPGFITADVHDPFTYSVISGLAYVIRNTKTVSQTAVLLRQSSVYNSPPIVSGGQNIAVVAITGKSKQLNRVSVLASGLVPDWNGTTWSGYNITSNPAPHFRDILTGRLNIEPLADELLDDAGLLAWRTYCDQQGLSCNMICEGRSVYEVLQAVASCGRAKPLSSDIWGVIVDRPRVSETPISIFTPRNSNNFSFEKLLPDRSQAFRVQFRNIDLDYEQDEIIVFDPDIPEGSAERFEQISYEGLVTETLARDRMLFDILQSKLRSTTYRLDTDIESLVCRRGDLIGVAHETIAPNAGYGRIKTINISGGLVQTIVLDNEVDLSVSTSFFSLSNVFTTTDIFNVGVPMGCALRLANGSGTILTKPLDLTISGTTDTLTFATPFALPAGLVVGILVAVGPVNAEYGRYIITDIDASADMTARLTMVDEAPGVHINEIGEAWSDDFFWDDNYGWSVGAT
jgi:hypothetical protein